MDFRETFRELYASLVYMWHRTRGVETDPLARRIAVHENAFGKSRPEMRRGHPGEARELVLEVDTTVEVAVDGEKQWLGIGDDYGYGLSRRERSEPLGMQFEKELEKRGYGRFGECEASDTLPLNKPSSLPPLDDPGANLRKSHRHEHRHRSWRQSPYERAAQSDPDYEEPRGSSSPKRTSRFQRNSRNTENSVCVYDDHPPPSVLRTYRDNRTASQTLPSGAQTPQLSQSKMIQDSSGLPPLPVNIARADTVLARLFSNQPLRSDGGHTSLSGGSVVSPSSQSHRTHLPFNAAPTVLPQNIGVGWPVEVTTPRPGSPNTNDAQELHAESTVLPISPPPVQQRQVQPDRSGPELPPLPPKDPRRSFHRRELANFQPSLAKAHVATAPMMPTVPAPNLVSDPKRIVTSSRREERSHYVGPLTDVRELPDSQTPSHRLPTPRTYADTFSGDRTPSPRNRAFKASVKVAVPTHTFSPESTRWLHSKGTPRMGGGMSPLPLRPSSFPLNRSSLYSLPDARSPPVAPRADQTLLRQRDS